MASRRTNGRSLGAVEEPNLLAHRTHIGVACSTCCGDAGIATGPADRLHGPCRRSLRVWTSAGAAECARFGKTSASFKSRPSGEGSSLFGFKDDTGIARTVTERRIVSTWMCSPPAGRRPPPLAAKAAALPRTPHSGTALPYTRRHVVDGQNRDFAIPSAFNPLPLAFK